MRGGARNSAPSAGADQRVKLVGFARFAGRFLLVWAVIMALQWKSSFLWQPRGIVVTPRTAIETGIILLAVMAITRFVFRRLRQGLGGPPAAAPRR